ncbi:DUF3365 domain-containing protein [Heliobacterium undosum]|uniref:DUF3365 domain-containing protein n=1 Tax=Heliomicrobium undosum TaxID=121734 RepID=A0A845L8G6_9FIRM|nr:methyl-accepting chemotaxis protein [Heliomicrobium undosum]MZP30018.1 DUF3365 domain-containing protein [Heliomicrobium undosum]
MRFWDSLIVKIAIYIMLGSGIVAAPFITYIGSKQTEEIRKQAVNKAKTMADIVAVYRNTHQQFSDKLHMPSIEVLLAMSKKFNVLPENDVTFHITSATELLINPENKPTEWDEKAMGQFVQAADNKERAEQQDFLEFQRMENREVLLYARPIYTTPGCLNCHPKNKVNEIAGIQTVSVDMSRSNAKAAALYWELGFLGIMLPLAITGLLAIIFRFQLLLPIRRQILTMEQVASGDLRIAREANPFSGEVGQLAQAFRAMTLRLSQLIEQIQKHSVQIMGTSDVLVSTSKHSTRAAEEVMKSARELACGATQTASQVEQGSGHAHDLAHILREVSDGAAKAVLSAKTTVEDAEKGQADLELVKGSMDAIQQAVNNAAERVASLKTRSLAIDEVIAIIVGISDQTNLLALNAAIEAARAGEHGRGFAVVADEVRRLAEQAKGSSEEVRRLIVGIRQEIDIVTEQTQNGSREVDSGYQVVQKASQSFNTIEANTRLLAIEIERVAEAAREITGKGDEIAKNFITIDEIARKNSEDTQATALSIERQLALIEELATTADTLKQVAHNLEETASQFVLP